MSRCPLVLRADAERAGLSDGPLVSAKAKVRGEEGEVGTRCGDSNGFICSGLDMYGMVGAAAAYTSLATSLSGCPIWLSVLLFSFTVRPTEFSMTFTLCNRAH